MKQIVLTIALAFILSSCSMGYYSYEQPVRVTGRVNIAVQPSWGPAGYDYAMYYYFPEFNFYYDVERALFYYQNYGRWVSAKVLPRNRHFPADLHRYYKVVINSHNPWQHNRQHKNQYKHFKGIYNQPNLRDSRMDNDYLHRNDPRTNDPRRIPNKGITPPRNNNTRPSTQPSYNRGEGSRPNMGQRPNNNSKPSVGTPPPNSSSRPNATRPNSSQGGVKSSSKSNSTSGKSTQGSSSRSTGSRSMGSRGR